MQGTNEVIARARVEGRGRLYDLFACEEFCIVIGGPRALHGMMFFNNMYAISWEF